MTGPRNLSEMSKFAGKWTDEELDVDLPDSARLIIGREDKVGTHSGYCVLCSGITYFTERDKPVLEIAAPVCSKCYLKSLKEK